MIFTLPVLAYQLFFVVILFISSRIGARIHLLTMLASLLWTATHLFFWPLALVQTLVILISYLLFRRKPLPAGQPPKP